jgi:lysosomal acid lipase/cholesteryl ester hydrolase
VVSKFDITTEDDWELVLLRIYREGVFKKEVIHSDHEDENDTVTVIGGETAEDSTLIDESAAEVSDDHSEDTSKYKKEEYRVPRVLMQHGSMQSGESWVMDANVNMELPFFLADIGYDVWLGNNRGAGRPLYSGHKHYSPVEDSKQYWDFSFPEMGKYDLPA